MEKNKKMYIYSLGLVWISCFYNFGNWIFKWILLNLFGKYLIYLNLIKLNKEYNVKNNKSILRWIERRKVI